MTTLVSRKYYTLGAPPPVADIDVGLETVIATMQIEALGNLLETGDTFQAGPAKLQGHFFKQGKYFEFQFSPRRSLFQASGLAVNAGIKTKEGLQDDWGDEIWPDVTWIDYTYVVGDFYHRIVP